MASKFRTISISEEDYAMYERLREAWAKEHKISPTRVSLASIVNIGMNFYIQRRKFQVEK